MRLIRLRFWLTCRRIARENPDLAPGEVCAAAVEEMEQRYGARADWATILQMLFEFILTILPFLFQPGTPPDVD